MSTQFRLLVTLCLGVFINVSVAGNDKNCLPYLSGLPKQDEMLVQAKNTNKNAKTYVLPATPATTQWGVFNNAQPPVLTIHPGDTVAIETMAASDNQVVPGSTIEQILEIQHAVADRGPHTLTGPIYVEGAEPGDILRVHINKILPRNYASNNNGPGKGLFPDKFPDNFVKYYYIDLMKKKLQFSPEIAVPIAPFPGIVAVAPKEPGSHDSAPPGQFGGNMDLRELVEGTTLYLPVFVKGALLWTGDSHAGQGNGEIDLTAMETAFQEFNITVDLIKQKPLDWPRVETSNAWISVGYDKDLNQALNILKDETVKLIMDQRHVDKAQAEKIMQQTWNCPIAEVVNGVQGVYCIVPKQGLSRPTLLQADNEKVFVTHAKNADIEQAMKDASWAMLNKMVELKKMSREDAYRLASFAMDCRIAPHQSGDKEVNCTLDKSLWV